MTQSCKESYSLNLDFDRSTLPSQGVVLQRRHFRNTLGSGRRKHGKRRGNAEKTHRSDPESEETLLIKEDSLVNPQSSNLKKPTYCTDAQCLVKRKYRMRDQFGDIVLKKSKAPTSTRRLLSFKWNDMKVINSVALNISSFGFGTLDMNFRGLVTFSVDYIDIQDQVRIAASELISCESFIDHRLSCLFLQTTTAACLRLRDCFSMSAGSETWYYWSKRQKEKYLTLTFEKEPTVLEKATLEEIFAEIGSLNNLSNFPTMLTFEEASDRLMSCKKLNEKPISRLISTIAPNETTTLSVSDSEGNNDNDVIECPTSVGKLVVYPPPPAKGGFSITEDDLSCLDEGEFLNDVIVDFYLKYLICEKLQKEDANRCHIFSSFFFKSLTHKDHQDTTGLSIQERRHNRVKTWTRHFDLFEKDFIFVPINQSAHWYLAVICFPGQVFQDDFENEDSTEYIPIPSLLNPMSIFYRQTASEQLSRWNASIDDLDKGFCLNSDDEMEDEVQSDCTTVGNAFNIASRQPCILIMDSLGNCSKPAVVKMLQEYLEMEWWVKKGTWQSFTKGAMNGWSLTVPQQDNFTDCGIYLLQYVESFIMNPPQILHPAMDLSDWFSQYLVKKKREKIKKLIFRLHHQQQF